MGPSSAAYLQTMGKTADFIGSGVDVTAIAKEFAKAVGNETVLLPQAIDSLRSIQKQLSFGNTCSNLFVYKTAMKQEFSIPHADILVFTSPSNARATSKATGTPAVLASWMNWVAFCASSLNSTPRALIRIPTG